MDASHAVAELPAELLGPPAILRGTARGLEVVVNARAEVEAIADAIETRLAEAPAFFRGSDARIRVEDGPLAPGCLARLDELAQRFELRIVEVAAARAERDAIPSADLATGTAPVKPELEAQPEPEPEPVSARMAAPAPVAEAAPEAPAPGTRLLVGPVRSGVILEHVGPLVIFGDVNPGAEVRATGDIVVLGRLRGTAHAGIGRDTGFILALRLEPQQLRIGRKVARATDSDTPASDAEIAYLTGDGIVVERYQGKLPRNLAAGIAASTTSGT
jgi:septum site-determining protein MinC